MKTLLRNAGKHHRHVDEDVESREEEGVTDAVQHLDSDDKRNVVAEERKDEESAGVPEDANDYSPLLLLVAFRPPPSLDASDK